MVIDLPFIWAAIIAFAVIAYVVMDGFDLGIGILFPLFPKKQDRDVMMNTVAPVWDGNETWLVLGGGGLLAVFPLAYAIVLPALYMPIIIMLLALIFRGVAFEYRWRTKRAEFLWNHAFAWGSTIAAFATVGAMGVFSLWTPFTEPLYLQRWFTGWTAVFSIVVPVLVLGCLYLILKGLHAGHDRRPFLGALGLFLLGYAGIGISFYPFIVPPSVTIAEAAAPDKSLEFLLTGAVVLIPMILAYTSYSYWVFRGKVTHKDGYH